MNKKRVLHIISFVLLALMFFKVSSLHVYSHQDSALDKIENCIICDSAIENQNAEHDFSLGLYLETPIMEKSETEPLFGKLQISTSSKTHFCLFGRPPPNYL